LIGALAGAVGPRSRGERGFVIVVASVEGELARVRARLGQLGISEPDVLALSEARRLVLAAVDDEAAATRLVATLRAAGEMVVMRPDAGPRLDGWRRHTRPVTFGERVSVCFVWSEHERRNLPGLVELDPDGGFGTGEHPTTRLLVEELVARIAGGERVLDVGCGSGILGLCALRLGAMRVVGVDVDPRAVEATRRNGALNGFERRVEATTAPLGEIGGVFDAVVANIGRVGIAELAPQLVRRVSPGGWLAVSGFAPAQCSPLATLLSPLEVVHGRVCGEWAALVLGLPRRPVVVQAPGPEVGEQRDADAPGDAPERVGSDRSAAQKESSEGVGHGCERLVAGELAETGRQAGGGHEAAPEEGQQGEDHGGVAGGLDALGGEAERDGEPGEGKREQGDDGDRGDPGEGAGGRSEPDRE
jgi:ribosomal protein L11 methylase PrmA